MQKFPINMLFLIYFSIAHERAIPFKGHFNLMPYKNNEIRSNSLHVIYDSYIIRDVNTIVLLNIERPCSTRPFYEQKSIDLLYFECKDF